MKDAIQKAIDGGYKPEKINHEFNWDEHSMSDNYQIDMRKCLLDPLFWQALGKSLGWKGNQTKIRIKYNPPSSKVRCSPEEYIEYGTNWLNEWHNFIDHLAEGKDAELFFKQLLK